MLSDNNKIVHRKKILSSFLICTGLFVLLFGRLVYLCVWRADYYAGLATDLHERERSIKAARGRILDRNGTVLADNRTVCTISVIHNQLEDPEEVIEILTKELELSEDYVRKRVEKYSAMERIKSNVDKELGDRIREYDLAGVTVDEDYKRYYPYDDLASKVLGFTGGDNQGIIGLEVVYDEYLQGEPGEILTVTDAKGIEVEAAFQYVNEFHENVLGFCNNIYNSEGGTHLTGFKTMFTNVINTYARNLGILKEKDANFTGADVRNGMTAVVSIKHPDPRFEGQTKTKLDNQDAAKVVSKVTGEEIVHFFDRNLETLKNVISCAEKAAKIRKSEERAKTNMLTKQKFSFDSNGKLANCESKTPSQCEIFIVEGDSAGGSAKTARARATQAILPLRGKILNVEKARLDKIYANAEIRAMITAFGTGIHDDFDISKLRYDKIILMTDADVDGAHISTLLLTFIYRFMPDLIREGHVYLAKPPLYKLEKNKKIWYAYSDEELDGILLEVDRDQNNKIQRYKGLGEMDAEQLWETTMDPERRILLRVNYDEEMESELDLTFTTLMGDKVEPRREFIEENAQFVKNLDIS